MTHLLRKGCGSIKENYGGIFMNKHRKALIAASAMTLLLVLGMCLIGGAALLNQNGVPNSQAASDTRTAGQAEFAAASSTALQADLQAQVSQLESMVSQYQQREGQYQDEISNLQTQLDQSQSQLTQYQQVLQFLVDRGTLQVNGNGQLTLGATRGEDD
jgi:peptidoglycan hydrolase CwlO-like protein